MVNVRALRGLTLVAFAITLAAETRALRVEPETGVQRELQLGLGNLLGPDLGRVTNLATVAPPDRSTTDSTPDSTTTTTPRSNSLLTPVTDLLATHPTATEAPLTNTAPSRPTPMNPPSSNTLLTPVTNLLTTHPTATEAPLTNTAPSRPTPMNPPSSNTLLTPVTNLLTTPPTRATATEPPSRPTPTNPPSSNSLLTPVTNLLTTPPTVTEEPLTTTAPSTLTPTHPPSSNSLLTSVTNLLTTPPTVTEEPLTTTAPSTLTPTDAPTATFPLTDLLTTAPTTTATLLPDITLVPSTTTASTTTTPSTTTSPSTLLPTLIPSATTSTPTTTDSPVTVTPITLTPSTDIPVTLTPSTESPVTTTPSTETPSTETPSTKTPSTETPSTETPSTATPSTETPSTSSGSSESPSSGSSDSTVTKSPAPVTKTPSSGSSDEESTSSPPPATATPTKTKSPIAIETNSGSEDESDASAQEDQTQSDVIMYNASATPMTATSGSSDPFAIPEDSSVTEKPVVLDISDNDNSPSDTTETYVRGKTTKSNSAAMTNANVIGGRNAYVDTENTDVLSSSAAAFHNFLRYASVAFAGISVALLLFFHFVSLDADLLWVNSAWSPNTWEFMFYVAYLQQMQATSELTVLKTPYFLWDYTDSFAWSNFLIQDSSSSDSSESRRLETVVLGGIVSYADRIGVSEEDILVDSAIGFAVIMGVLLVVFLVLAVMAKRKAEKALDESSDLNSYTSGVHRLRSVSIRALGLCVLVWYFSLFPLSMLASFEISMEVQASTIADALVIAIIALVLVCFGVLAVAGRVIMHKTKDELEQFENLATWGSLYCEYTYRSRMFFVIDVVVQISTGVLVGCVSGDPTQLIVVMGIQALYLACVFIMSPFADQMVLRITYVLGLLKILNFGLAFAFLNSNTMSATARTRVAHAFIGINSIVILVWFIRQLVVFSTYIRAWMVRSNDESRRSNSVIKYDRQGSETESEMYASQYTARGGLADSRGLNDSVNGATLSFPKGSSVLSMQPSYGPVSSVQSMTTSYGKTSSQQSMGPSFGSESQYQQINRKYEVGF